MKNADSASKAIFQREVQQKGLSRDLLRKYNGLENISDEDAQQAVQSIEKLTEFLFSFFKNQEINTHEDKSIN